MSSARFWHFAFAIVFLVAYLHVNTPRGKGLATSQLLLFMLALPVLYLGSAVSDWDIWLFGIGGHRHPIFHSAAPYVLLVYLCRTVEVTDRFRTLIIIAQVSFALGLASHLVLDVIQYGNVKWIPGGTLDRMWLAGNAAVLGVAVWFASRRSASAAKFLGAS